MQNHHVANRLYIFIYIHMFAMGWYHKQQPTQAMDYNRKFHWLMAHPMLGESLAEPVLDGLPHDDVIHLNLTQFPHCCPGGTDHCGSASFILEAVVSYNVELKNFFKEFLSQLTAKPMKWLSQETARLWIITWCSWGKHRSEGCLFHLLWNLCRSGPCLHDPMHPIHRLAEEGFPADSCGRRRCTERSWRGCDAGLQAKGGAPFIARSEELWGQACWEELGFFLEQRLE